MNALKGLLVAGAFGTALIGAPHQALAIVDIGLPVVCIDDDADGVGGEIGIGDPRGTSPECPLLPDFILETAFWFTFDVDQWIDQWGEDAIVWFDPPAVVSYTYEAIGAEFLGVELPPFAVVPNPNDYTVTAGADAVDVGPEGTVDFLDVPFGGAQSIFTVSGISAALGLQADDELAFPIGLLLGHFSGQSFTVTITPTVVPLPAAGLLYLGALGFLGIGLARRRRRAA